MGAPPTAYILTGQMTGERERWLEIGITKMGRKEVWMRRETQCLCSTNTELRGAVEGVTGGTNRGTNRAMTAASIQTSDLLHQITSSVSTRRAQFRRLTKCRTSICC